MRIVVSYTSYEHMPLSLFRLPCLEVRPPPAPRCGVGAVGVCRAAGTRYTDARQPARTRRARPLRRLAICAALNPGSLWQGSSVLVHKGRIVGCELAAVLDDNLLARGAAWLPYDSIVLTTFMPLITLPKTTCLPS